MNKIRLNISFMCVLVLVVVLNIGRLAVRADELVSLETGWNGYIRTGDTKKALSQFKKAYQENPGKMKVASSYSQLLIQVGEYSEAASVLTEAFKVCEWDEWCEPALADLGSIVDYMDSTTELAGVLQNRLGNKNISWIEKSLLSDLLARLLLQSEKIAEAEELYSKAGYVKEWLILGPFSNRNQQKFLVTNQFENESAVINLNKKWQGRGREIEWQRIPSPMNGVVNLGMVVYPSDESMGYMLCYVEAEKEGKAVLAIEESGASALWVNGELNYVDSTYVQNDSALQRLIGVNLKKGINQIVLKVAGGRDVQPKARLRVVYGSVSQMAKKGSALMVEANMSAYRVSVSDEAASEYKKSKNAIVGAGKMPVIEQGNSWGTSGALWGALEKFEEMSSNKDMRAFYEYSLALMNMGYLINHYGFDSSERSRERVYDTLLITDYPNCPLFLNSAAYVQIGDNTKRELLLKAIEISPQEIAAKEGLMHLQVQGGFYIKAWESAEKIAAESGWSFSTYSTIASIAERNQWTPEAALYYSKALEYLSGAGWVYARKAANSGSVGEAISILKAGRKRVFDVSIAESLGGWLYKDSRFSESRDVYDKMLRIEKYQEESWDAAAACSVALGEYTKAINTLKEGLVWMPQSPFLREQIGRLLIRIDKKEEGVEFLRASLNIQEDNPDLAAYIAELSNSEGEFYSAENILYESLEGKGITPSDYPDYDRVCLLDQNYVVVSKNATTKRMIRKVMKVLRESAINEVSVTGIYYDSSRQKVELKHARVIQPSGEINENPVVEDGMYNTGYDAGGIYGSAQVRSIQLPNVKEGSIVDVMYTIEDMGANVYHDQFSDIVYLGDVEPTLKFVYAAIVPEGMDVESQVYGGSEKATKRQVDGGMTEVRLEVDNIPGLRLEPMMPPIQEVKPSLVLSTFKDWQEMAKWANGLFAPEIVLPDDIKKVVHSIVKDASTRDEKIDAIFRYVSENIRYVSISYGRFGYVPHKAERTFRAGYGDCKDTAVLLVAMLEEVGIKAYPTLTRTRDQGALLEKLPSPELFNHSIAYVPETEDGKERHYWLDGTTDYYSLGMIPAMDRGTESLIIKPDGGLVEVDKLESSQDIQISSIKFTVNTGGSGNVVGREIYRGRNSVGLRRTLENPEAFFSMLKEFFSNRFAGAKIANLDYSKDNSKPESWFEYSVDSDKIALEDGRALKMLPWVFPLNISGIAVLKDREYDLDLGAPRVFEVVADIKLGDGLKVISGLPNIDEEIDAIAYKREFEVTDSGVKVVSKIVIKKARVEKENYQEFRAFVNMITARSKEWVFLTK